MAGNLRKSYANNKNYHLSIPDSVVEWCGWPNGPYGDKGETFRKDIKDDKGKVLRTEDVLKNNSGLAAPTVNIIQEEEYDVPLIQALDLNPPTIKNGGIKRWLKIEWKE
jgi:hypothetical protein